MPKFNADSTIFEPIEVTLNNKVYTVGKITQEKLRSVRKLGEDDPENPSIVCNQLAIFFDCEVSEFEAIDFRVLAKVSNFVMNSVSEQTAVQAKNGSGEA